MRLTGPIGAADFIIEASLASVTITNERSTSHFIASSKEVVLIDQSSPTSGAVLTVARNEVGCSCVTSPLLPPDNLNRLKPSMKYHLLTATLELCERPKLQVDLICFNGSSLVTGLHAI